jgi:exodeoxyribonuclease V alpha subunit
LPSVDIGAMFWSLVVDRAQDGHRLAKNIVFLTTTYRSNNEILTLAQAFLRGDKGRVLSQLRSLGSSSSVRWLPLFEAEELYRLIVQSYGLKPLPPLVAYEGGALTENQQIILDEYFTFFDNFVVLTPINQGAFGVQGINTGVMRLLGMANHAHGQPILLTTNSSALGLSNGDRGVLVLFGTVLYAVFKQNGAYALYLPSQLSRYESAFAITVHKSQGSEYSRVLLVMDESSERVLNGRLTYTALTRAKNGVVICAAMSEILRATDVMPERTVRLGEVLCPAKLMVLPKKGSQLGLF